MKKVITAAVMVAFVGAVAFASLESKDSSKKQQKQLDKKEQKETEKKKERKRSCLFS